MYLLDTNVLSELRKLRKGRAAPQVARWFDNVELMQLHVSVISIEEIEVGIFLKERRDVVQGRILREWLEEQLLPAFDGRLLPVDLAIARRCAGLHVPDPRPESDSLIAATALVHGMTLVTRNVVDFQPMGVSLLNPWNP